MAGNEIGPPQEALWAGDKKGLDFMLKVKVKYLMVFRKEVAWPD